MIANLMSYGRHVMPVLAVAAIAAASSVGCESERVVLADPPSTPGAFETPDAGADASTPNELMAYCPSDECPPGRATCPGSRFPCDVDLAVDQNNCGACGFACPQGTYGSSFVCVEGTCQIACNSSPSKYLDCDGFVDNGCEVRAETNDDCGACGKKCADPDKPCVERPVGGWDCGCIAPDIVCPLNPATLACTNPQIDDENCDGCGNRCSPADGEGKPERPNAYFGCVGGTCGNYKCKRGYADCNGDLNAPDVSDGCEVYTWDDQNCGGCGVACAPGQQCQPDAFGNPFCACPQGLTYCGTCYGSWPDGCSGSCVDIRTNTSHCGGCGSACPSNDNDSFPVCEFGSCGRRCVEGRADCNGNVEDSCEVAIDSDPYNCGACGHVCDAVAGQACVHGRCALEPCPEQDAGAPQ